MSGQDAIFAFMGDGASYDPPVENVSRIDTHAAVIFLAGDIAYKIKRAVKLEYLDFSTLEKRRAVCERELEINSATAPGLYLDVIPITKEPSGSLAISGEGKPVEWAIRMRRFDQSCLLDHQAKLGELPLAIMNPLAKTVAEFHARAKADLSPQGAKRMARVANGVMQALSGPGPLLPAEEVDSFCASIRATRTAYAKLLNARAQAGFVRRCHGDLHLGNIVLLDGKPVPFDALEFDEELATVDVLYDLAFLLMDLCHRNLPVHANAILNAYCARGDASSVQGLEGLSLLPLFLATRAGVRAMVGLDRLKVAEGEAREETAEEIKEFFSLGRSFLEKAEPRLIAVGGLSGTGKTTLARNIAPRAHSCPGALIVRSDVERKRLAGVQETERLGPDAYTVEASVRVYEVLYRKAATVLKAGRSVVLDAVFAREEERTQAEQIAGRLNVPFTGLWLEAPEKDLISRVGSRSGDASDADERVVQKQLEYETGNITWQRIDAQGEPEAVMKRAMAALAID